MLTYQSCEAEMNPEPLQFPLQFKNPFS